MEKKETKRPKKHVPIYTTLNILDDDHRNSTIPNLKSLHVERQKSRKSSREDSIKDSIDKFNQVNSIWQDFKKHADTRSLSASPKVIITSPFSKSIRTNCTPKLSQDQIHKTNFASYMSSAVKNKKANICSKYRTEVYHYIGISKSTRCKTNDYFSY